MQEYYPCCVVPTACQKKQNLLAMGEEPIMFSRASLPAFRDLQISNDLGIQAVLNKCKSAFKNSHAKFTILSI